ncbi:hypothetical protein C8J56DRAFT_993320 [Mycena floridula]|nr:hypothetical protein C8J56DRAFT_993320 [Mycena floridula]
MAPPLDIYRCLSNFNEKKFLKECSGYLVWAKEFTMTFRPYPELWNFISKPQTVPEASDTAAMATYNTLNVNGCTAIYKTIESSTLQDEFVKDDIPAYTIWADMKSKLDSDNRSSRHDLLSIIFNPVHDPSKDVLEHFVAPITSAGEALGKLGYKLEPALIVDTIIMHLHQTWSVTQEMLVGLPTDPTIDSLRAQLKQAQSGTKLKALLGQDIDNLETNDEPSALAAFSTKGKKQRRSHRSRSKSYSDSEDDHPSPKYHWLEPENDRDCQWCGISGHPAKFCMAVMPQHVIDKILKMSAQKRKVRNALLAYDFDLGLSDSDNVKPSQGSSSRHSGHAAGATADLSSASDSDSDDGAVLVGPEQIWRARESGFYAKVYG